MRRRRASAAALLPPRLRRRASAAAPPPPHSPSLPPASSSPTPRRFVRPLYRALHASGGAEGAALATETFTRLRSGYHAIAQKMIAADLGL